MHRKHLLAALISSLCAGLAIAPLAQAAVSADEAAKLKTTLTPLGAERAGNKDASIPAWDGGMTKAPAGYKSGDPRPEITPSSCAASVNPIEIPAPTEAASATVNVVEVDWVANAVAKIGASVDTDPSIRPASPGCTQVRMN